MLRFLLYLWLSFMAFAPVWAQSLPLSFAESGSYLRGCTPGQQPCPAGLTAQSVSLGSFALSRFEVTQAQYEAITGASPSANTGCPDCPVEQVSWYEALSFCNQLSVQEGLPVAYYADPALSQPYAGTPGPVYWDRESTGFRLPTEAEWEYAARSGPAAEDFRYAGSSSWTAVAATGGGTQAVGSKPPNALGLYDLSGNVAEWCWDWQGDYPLFPVCDPYGPASGTARVLRGGSFLDAAGVSIAERTGAQPLERQAHIGFRVARYAGYMVNVPGGTFTMGCTAEQEPDCQNNEYPAHTVTVSSFELARYELTQGEWAALVPEYTPNYSFGQAADIPTYRVSWYDAATYCNRRSLAEGLTPAYYADAEYAQPFDALVGDQLASIPVYWDKSANGYRFPTEAEWAFAGRGGANGQGFRYAGSNDLGEVAWYVGNSGNTAHAVGQLLPNELGLYDMTGNIYEWCWDFYDANYYQVSPEQDPTGPDTGNLHSIRGGSWNSTDLGARLSNRLNFLPGARRTTFGFRLARSINP